MKRQHQSSQDATSTFTSTATYIHIYNNTYMIPVMSVFKRDMNRSAGKERWIHCYKSSQKILLVGEGDFSFSACLARAFCTAENIVATSYLGRPKLVEDHWTSIPHLEDLERLGCLLLYKVDVYKMHTHPTLKNMKFDVIIFNFPHAGHYDHLSERDHQLIEMHMELVEAFFESASKMLSKGGEVHLRHREDSPYDRWNVVSLATKAGLVLKEKVDFEKSDYPGYHNKRGGGINTNKSFPIQCAYTYKFALHLPKKDASYDDVNAPEIKDEAKSKNECFVQKNDEVEPLKNIDVDDEELDLVLKRLNLCQTNLEVYLPKNDGVDDNFDGTELDLDLDPKKSQIQVTVESG